MTRYVRVPAPHLPDDHVVLIARFKDGSARYFKARVNADGEWYTDRPRDSLCVTRAEAEETISRLHCVQAEGHYHQAVEVFDLINAKPGRPLTRHGTRTRRRKETPRGRQRPTSL
jgi:hypothetical protein